MRDLDKVLQPQTGLEVNTCTPTQVMGATAAEGRQGTDSESITWTPVPCPPRPGSSRCLQHPKD